MKKVSKLSLTLASLGVFMIGLAGVLQYQAFKMEDHAVTYEKVTMKDMNSGTVEEVNNIKEEYKDKIDLDLTIEEVYESENPNK